MRTRTAKKSFKTKALRPRRSLSRPRLDAIKDAFLIKSSGLPQGLREARKPFMAFPSADKYQAVPIEIGTAEVIRGLLPSLIDAKTGGALRDEEARLLDEAGFEDEPLSKGQANPVSEGIKAYQRLLNESLSTDEVAKLLGVQESRIRQRLIGEQPSLYGIKQGKSWRIPKFQFVKGRLITGIEKVIRELNPTLHPVEVWRWFTTKNQELVTSDEVSEPVTPLEWLQLGYPSERLAVQARSVE